MGDAKPSMVATCLLPAFFSAWLRILVSASATASGMLLRPLSYEQMRGWKYSGCAVPGSALARRCPSSCWERPAATRRDFRLKGILPR